MLTPCVNFRVFAHSRVKQSSKEVRLKMSFQRLLETVLSGKLHQQCKWFGRERVKRTRTLARILGETWRLQTHKEDQMTLMDINNKPTRTIQYRMKVS